MKIFTTQQIAEVDRYTIENEPIADVDLMERASLQIVNWLIRNVSNEQKLMVFAGPGNNGGDALAIARIVITSYSIHYTKLYEGSSSSAQKSYCFKLKGEQAVLEFN